MSVALRAPRPWLVEWEDPALVDNLCLRHFAPTHVDDEEPCGLWDREPTDTMRARGFDREQDARDFAESKAAEPRVGMISITQRRVEEDTYAPGLWDVTDLACWYRTTDGNWAGGSL